jgi:hypothetical protein
MNPSIGQPQAAGSAAKWSIARPPGAGSAGELDGQQFSGPRSRLVVYDRQVQYPTHFHPPDGVLPAPVLGSMQGPRVVAISLKTSGGMTLACP